MSDDNEPTTPSTTFLAATPNNTLELHPFLLQAPVVIHDHTLSSHDEQVWHALNRLAGIVEAHDKAIELAGLTDYLKKASDKARDLVSTGLREAKGFVHSLHDGVNTEGLEYVKRKVDSKPWGDQPFSDGTLNDMLGKLREANSDIAKITIEINSNKSIWQHTAEMAQTGSSLDLSKYNESIQKNEPLQKKLIEAKGKREDAIKRIQTIVKDIKDQRALEK